jgi:hypothetical protein
MRRALLGLMLFPVVFGSFATVVGRGAHDAVASPIEAQPAARVARMLTGEFRVAPRGTGEGRVGAIERKACRVAAPDLGEHVIYTEERFAHGNGHPYAQRLYVVDGVDARHARVREFAFADPGAVEGLCGAPSPATLSAGAVEEVVGCAVTVTFRGDRFEGTTRGTACRSVLNGASHTKREVLLSDATVSIRDRGFDASGAIAWGAQAAPLRFERKAPARP